MTEKVVVVKLHNRLYRRSGHPLILVVIKSPIEYPIEVVIKKVSLFSYGCNGFIHEVTGKTYNEKYTNSNSITELQ